MPATRVAANCEAGGYGIHTVATYKPFDPARTWFVYGREGDLLRATLNAVDLEREDEVRARMRGRFTLLHGARACDGVEAGIDGEAIYEPPYHWDLGVCDALVDSDVGYAVADLEARSIRVPARVAVRAGATPASSRRREVETAVRGDLAERTLHLVRAYVGDVWNESDPAPPWIASARWEELRETREAFWQARQEANRIGPDERDAIAFDYTAIGADLLLVHATLRITRPRPGWEPLETPLPEPGGGADAVSFDFPTFFLAEGDAPPRFVGDGSQCAFPLEHEAKGSDAGAYGIFAGYGEPRFDVTHAFDLDLDGRADVLEINGRFAYELSRDGALRVISFGMGC